MTRRPPRPAENLGETIGAAIRARRTSQGVTMQQLAERAALSQPFLSKVERGLAGLSMGSLNRVAQALGTTGVGLFGGMQPDRAAGVVRGDARPALPSDDGGTVAHALTARAGQLRAVEITGGPPELPASPYVHRNDSLSVVLSGSYEFETDGERFVLGAGDTFSASGGIPIRYRVVQEPARMLVIIVSEDVEVVNSPLPAPIARRKAPRQRDDPTSRAGRPGRRGTVAR